MSEKVSAVNHEAIKPESVKQTIDGFESQLLEASSHIDAAQAKVDALNFRSDATDHVYAKAELRDARDQYQPVLDSLSEQWATHGGARIDAARAAVDALNFRSDATDHVYAKAELRDAEDAWVESYNAAQQEPQPGELEEVSANETNEKESEEANTSEGSAASRAQDKEALSPLDHPVEVAVQDGESREEYEERIGTNQEPVPLMGDSLKIDEPVELTPNASEENHAADEQVEPQDTPKAEEQQESAAEQEQVSTEGLTWKDALRNPGGYLAIKMGDWRRASEGRRLSSLDVTDDHVEKRFRTDRNLKMLVGAVAGVAIVYFGHKLGTDIINGFGDHSTAVDIANQTVGNADGGNLVAPSLPSVEGSGQDWGGASEYSDAARTVTDGEGLYNTFDELNIPQAEWGNLLQKVGPQLAENGWAYRMPNGSWGLSHTGQLPDSMLQLIQKSR